MDDVPDLGALDDDELKGIIAQLTEEEHEVSYRRRILHGRIDILRAELVNRRHKQLAAGESAISGGDIQLLTDILAGKSFAPGDPDSEGAGPEEPEPKAGGASEDDADPDAAPK